MRTVRFASTVRREGALVIGGDYRALGIVRSLGRRGIPVWVFTNEHRVAAASRYARSHLPWPEKEHEQLERLLGAYRRHNLHGWTVFPSDDESAAFLARHHAKLSACFRMTTPDWETLQWCYDKRLTYRVAAGLGIDQPFTFVPSGRSELSSLDQCFPLILKPAFKQSNNPFTCAKAWRADTREALAAAYDQACRLVDPEIIMIQALVPGGGEQQASYAALAIDGSVVASLTARRIRQYPSEFGRASSFVECVEVPEIEEPSKRLLKAIGLTGLVEIEFKRDSRDGIYKLLDVNPRIWGWHTLARRVGIDFPYLLWKVVHAEHVPELRAARDARWVRMLTDTPVAWRDILRRRLTFSQYMRSFRTPLEFAIFAPDDPVPALIDGIYLTWLALRRWRR